MDVSVRVTVAYRSDPEVVREVMLATASESGVLAADPAPLVLVDDFADNGFSFLLRGRPKGPLLENETASALRFALVRAFRARDIEIAVPQSDLRWRDLDALRDAFNAATRRALAAAAGKVD